MSLPPPSASEQRFEFHRLLRRDERYRWWRPLALLGTGTGFFLVLTVIVIAALFATMMFNPAFWGDDTAAVDEFFNTTLMDMSNPTAFFLTMLSIIVMLPAAWLAYLLLGAKPTGLLFSVVGRIRFKWLGLVALVSLAVYAVYFSLSFILDALDSSTNAAPSEVMPANPLFYALLVILLTPLQCAAEELVFRGAFMQVIGAWLKHPAFAILLPVPLFTFGHLYDVFGLLDVAFFAVAAGYLTWRTGGLEAAIAVHVVNNTTLFLLGAIGQIDVNDTESTWQSLLSSMVMTTVLTLIIVKLAARRNIERSAPPAPRTQRPPLLQPWPMGYGPHHNQPQAYWAPPAPPVQPPQGPQPPIEPPR
ncbi:CPBP family intramembrane glutamic endopeptidase [Glutamicibacter sp.]|uniref:CPBP family intramembrane glutamic endopeptidase n=1 Tax=Glutamicibacter sp. TaxID=1931995 RepID=UPI0028BD911B|nr:CPBP family intramembrane glutamic endopeptidase [Glutamicibacter sp.]